MTNLNNEFNFDQLSQIPERKLGRALVSQRPPAPTKQGGFDTLTPREKLLKSVQPSSNLIGIVT